MGFDGAGVNTLVTAGLSLSLSLSLARALSLPLAPSACLPLSLILNTLVTAGGSLSPSPFPTFHLPVPSLTPLNPTLFKYHCDCRWISGAGW